MRVILAQGGLDCRGAVVEGVRVFEWIDDLSVGPVSDWRDVEAFRRQRARFQLACSFDEVTQDWDEEVLLDPWHPTYPVQTLDWLTVSTAEAEAFFESWEAQEPWEEVVTKAERVVIAYGDSVQGTLFAAYLLTAVQRSGVGRLAAIQHDGLPQLDEVLAAPARVLREAEIARFTALWTSWVDGDVEALAQLDGDVCTALMRRRAGADGLTELERDLLRVTQPAWRKMTRIVAEVMAGPRDGPKDYPRDGFLQKLLEDMARRDPALVEIRGDGAAMRRREVRLTEAGQAVPMP
ncbi:hypothetical protein [Tropicibacter alexandrii]|uniref:hypothetical protein n=1 Tax=Tropicibacter alexandrii TaxID=2267683 RepID=UPI000EF443C0|nr:hypothetical protein [Tropicibacter alexandrii]